MNRKFRFGWTGGLAGLLALVLTLCNAAFGASFTASLDRTSIVLGEQVTLTLTVEGAQPETITDLPAIDGIRRLSGFARGVNSSITPAGSTTVYTYSTVLTATRPGDFIIPPFRAKVNGENLSSQPIRLKVAAEDSAAPPASFGAKQVFLWPVLKGTNLIVGQTVVGELRLYVRNDIRNIGDLNIPLAGDGFTFGNLVQGQRFRRAVGGNPFTVLPFSFSFTPIKAGDLSLGPINGSVVLNPPNMMDIESIVGGSRAQQATLTTDPVSIQVASLPKDGAPADFTGAVGRFTMNVSVGPTNVAVGDPITVRVQISGEGQLDSLNLPEHSDWRDFKLYPPTSKVETTSQFGNEGTKTFEQVVIPQNADIRAVPAFSFSYYDPDQRSYRTLQQPAVPILVRPGGSLPAPSVAATRNSDDNQPPRSQDIVPIKQRLGTVSEPAPALIRQPWFISLQSVPLLALLGAVAWRKRNDALANNPRLRRQRQVTQVVRDGLKQLHASAKANDSDAFFATVFRLLQEQL
ncbi:MAG TPA: BatD family protein, partial [Candidatus Paceibacterota bacterium]|nr:BatD family protein [Candidatus Paceibacterota bacterium]